MGKPVRHMNRLKIRTEEMTVIAAIVSFIAGADVYKRQIYISYVDSQYQLVWLLNLVLNIRGQMVQVDLL